MTVKITYPFTTPGNYIYDSDKVEIVGGVAKLKSQVPPDETFYANYKNNINGTRGKGNLTGTPFGGASVLDGKLDLAHNDNRYVQYDADLNADSQQVGCINFKVIPNYSGTPTTNEYYFTVFKNTGDVANLISFIHSAAAGNLFVSIYDSSAVVKVSINIPAFSPVSGTPYEFELNYDGNTGATRLFIDGIQQGATNTNTFVRDSSINFVRIGEYYTGTNTSNFYIDDIVIYDTVQHTANYTPQPVSETVYPTTNPTIEMTTGFNLETLEGFIETSTKTGSDEIKYVLKKGNDWYYYSAGNWIITTGDNYTESNTAGTINAVKATFTDTGIESKVKLFLHSANGSTTPEIDQLEVDYNYYAGEPTLPATCIVFGYCFDESSNPVEGAKIEIYLTNNPAIYNNNLVIIFEKIEIETQNNGYWDISLIESVSMDANYVFKFTRADDIRIYTKIVPAGIKNFAELEDA